MQSCCIPRDSWRGDSESLHGAIRHLTVSPTFYIAPLATQISGWAGKQHAPRRGWNVLLARVKLEKQWKGSVELDDEFGFWSCEMDDVAAKWRKFIAMQQQAPALHQEVGEVRMCYEGRIAGGHHSKARIDWEVRTESYRRVRRAALCWFLTLATDCQSGKGPASNKGVHKLVLLVTASTFPL